MNGIVHGNVQPGHISKLLESILTENTDDYTVYDYRSRGVMNVNIAGQTIN